MQQPSDLPWFYSHNEEAAWSGPFDTREAAIDEARVTWEDMGFYVAQCECREERLSDWIEADSIIERAEENITDSDRMNYEFDECVFEVTAEQQDDLTARLKRACDEWQEVHGLKFVPRTFAFMGPVEWIAPIEAKGGES